MHLAIVRRHEVAVAEIVLPRMSAPDWQMKMPLAPLWSIVLFVIVAPSATQTKIALWTLSCSALRSIQRLARGPSMTTPRPFSRSTLPRMSARAASCTSTPLPGNPWMSSEPAPASAEVVTV